MAEGVVGASFEVFVFFYYSQVLGLSASLCGLALLIAVLSDAVTDPMVGTLSDGWRSRWGRRHPFMVAAILPLGLGLFAIFSPPQGLDHWALFAWLTVCTVGLHLALTLYHIPHMALGAELSSDYAERTRIVAYRAFFQLVAGGAVIPVCFALFFVSSERFDNGQLDPSAYPEMAAGLAVLTSAAILGTSLGTRARIPWLIRAVGGPAERGLSRILSELRTALRSPNYVSLLVGFVLLLVGRSFTTVLGMHLLTYFWRLTPAEIAYWGAVGLVGSLVGVPAWAAVALRLGKKQIMVTGLGLSGAAMGLPPLLHLAGLFPARDSAFFTDAIFAFGFLAQFAWAANMVVVGSMVADLADEHEWFSGRRQEGMLFAGLSFSFKLARAIAVQLAGIATAWVGLEVGAAPEEVSVESSNGIAFLYCVPLLIFTAASLGALHFYRLSESNIREIQREIEWRRNTPDGTPGGRR
jgi:GPH family glycoside/pentoside/hexuronide:cation symporter